jgi:hypothetical protein
VTSARVGNRAGLVAAMRGLRRPAGAAGAAAATDRCGLCQSGIPEDHRHLLHLGERRIVCVCGTCWALRSGDAEYRPAGSRIVWLPDLDLPDHTWARFAIPIGLAFFMLSGSAGGVVALYPSPAGATESELPMEAWRELCAANPVLDTLEPDAEGLIVNRLGAPAQHVIAPIDRCYALVGLVKMRWEGISGGPGLTDAVRGYLEDLRRLGEGRT